MPSPLGPDFSGHPGPSRHPSSSHSCSFLDLLTLSPWHCPSDPPHLVHLITGNPAPGLAGPLGPRGISCPGPVMAVPFGPCIPGLDHPGRAGTVLCPHGPSSTCPRPLSPGSLWVLLSLVILVLVHVLFIIQVQSPWASLLWLSWSSSPWSCFLQVLIFLLTWYLRP